MIVLVHGGPTARAQEGLSFKVQWWTSRGFAVLDVNYGGSTGFGRQWRERLKGPGAWWMWRTALPPASIWSKPDGLIRPESRSAVPVLVA